MRPLGPLFMQAPCARDCFVPVKQKFLDEQRYFQNAEQLVPFWWVVDLTWANVRHVTYCIGCMLVAKGQKKSYLYNLKVLAVLPLANMHVSL